MIEDKSNTREKDDQESDRHSQIPERHAPVKCPSCKLGTLFFQLGVVICRECGYCYDA